MNLNEYRSAIKTLNNWTKMYDEGTPAVSDKDWDDLYFSITEYEQEHPEDISIESPTQNISYEVVNKLR